MHDESEYRGPDGLAFVLALIAGYLNSCGTQGGYLALTNWARDTWCSFCSWLLESVNTTRTSSCPDCHTLGEPTPVYECDDYVDWFCTRSYTEWRVYNPY